MGEAKPPHMLTVSLRRGGEQFWFRYERGDESKVLDALVELVKRPDVAFYWFDAGVVSHQMGVQAVSHA